MPLLDESHKESWKKKSWWDQTTRVSHGPTDVDGETEWVGETKLGWNSTWGETKAEDGRLQEAVSCLKQHTGENASQHFPRTWWFWLPDVNSSG